jgi:probable phosphoglycerate mutase
MSGLPLLPYLLQRAQKAAAAMTAKAAELVLVRHGETDWNREHRLQGQQQPGPPLNQLGWQQCELVSSKSACNSDPTTLQEDITTRGSTSPASNTNS